MVGCALEWFESLPAVAVDFEHGGVFGDGATLPIPNIFDDKPSHNLGNLDSIVHKLGSVLKWFLKVVPWRIHQ